MICSSQLERSFLTRRSSSSRSLRSSSLDASSRGAAATTVARRSRREIWSSWATAASARSSQIACLTDGASCSASARIASPVTSGLPSERARSRSAAIARRTAGMPPAARRSAMGRCSAARLCEQEIPMGRSRFEARYRPTRRSLRRGRAPGRGLSSVREGSRRQRVLRGGGCHPESEGAARHQGSWGGLLRCEEARQWVHLRVAVAARACARFGGCQGGLLRCEEARQWVHLRVAVAARVGPR